jgi:hypothetical protein
MLCLLFVCVVGGAFGCFWYFQKKNVILVLLSVTELRDGGTESVPFLIMYKVKYSSTHCFFKRGGTQPPGGSLIFFGSSLFWDVVCVKKILYNISISSNLRTVL